MKTDICILGAGIMGLATAHYLCKNTDSRVLVLDRYGVGNDFCSSNDVNRVFRYAYGSDELYTRMAVESGNIWRKLEEESSQDLLIQTGLILLQGEDENANAFNEASYKTLSRMGLGAARLTGEELRKRFPQFRADEAFFDPHGGALLATKSLQTLQTLTATGGVTYQQGQGLEIVPSESLVTTDSHEEVRFRKLVVTVGPWTNSLRPERLVPVNPTRQQVVYFRPKNGIERFRPGRCPVFFTDKHYGLPAAGFDGVKVSPKELSEPVDPENVKRSVDSELVSDCREACKKFVPSLADGEVVRSKVCLYDMTENSDFVLDCDPKNPNIVYGYGFSGHGFKFAPLIGKLLAELALDKSPSFDLRSFSAMPAGRRRPTLGAQLGQGE